MVRKGGWKGREMERKGDGEKGGRVEWGTGTKRGLKEKGRY